ncbi:protein kinase superfamily protein [Artemisia annua]|uniref:Protein kinase superfamily protein n=1 Tax=Artemisia annua TaxID=35608 RepID=A0A2U1P8G3_ARTAN|nr:protein kinase superfamily protein [Artemisia annua]
MMTGLVVGVAVHLDGSKVALALLKGRFLRNQRFVEVEKQSSVAASDLGLLRKTHAIADIRAFDVMSGRRGLKSSDFLIGEKLGEGSFGVVYSGVVVPKGFSVEDRVRISGSKRRLLEKDVRFKEKVKVRVQGAIECGDFEEWFNYRQWIEHTGWASIRSLCPSSHNERNFGREGYEPTEVQSVHSQCCHQLRKR